MGSVIRLLLPLAGLAILAILLASADLATVWQGLIAVGLLGVVLILIVHAISFCGDSALWLLCYTKLSFTWRWIGRLYVVRLVGEAYNQATPLASVGGEPLKAKILKDRYGVAYTDSASAFLIDRTANLVALGLFLAIGFLALIQDHRFDIVLRHAASVGLLGICMLVVAVGLMQTIGLFARVKRSRDWLPNSRIAVFLDKAIAFEQDLAHFYAEYRARFGLVVTLALLTWISGIVEIWIVLTALDVSVGLLDLWLVEAIAQLVRAAVFFIPSGIGVVDASFVSLIALLTGDINHGAVVAITRRFRDLVWIAAGMLLAVPVVSTRR